MRFKVYFLLLLLLIPISAISAASVDTTIKVNTVPDFNLTAAIKDVVGNYHYVTQNTGSDGVALIRFSLESSTYKLTLSLRKGSETEFLKRYEESYTTGEDFEMNFYPKWYTPPQPENKTNVTVQTNNSSVQVNETQNETKEENFNQTQELKTSGKQKVTALSVSDGVIQINGKTFAYAGGIIILAILIFLFIRWEKHKPKKEKKIKVTKLSEFKQKNDDEIDKQKQKISEAKAMIKEAEEELEKINNPQKSKIEEAKKKLIEDEKELMRLRNESQESEEKKE